MMSFRVLEQCLNNTVVV